MRNGTDRPQLAEVHQLPPREADLCSKHSMLTVVDGLDVRGELD
jgi:hypothetical protein